jgi:hypothetical protein
MNKHPRNILKSPGEQFPPHCLDTCGGHFVLSQRAKLDGVLDADGAAGEALRELNSEVKGPNEFMPEDLVYLGSLTYDDPKNRELRLVYGVRLTGKAEDYVMQDDILTPEGTYQYIKLPCEAHAYRELLRILHNAPKDTMIHDGLGQLLECVRLPESVESKVGLRLD